MVRRGLVLREARLPIEPPHRLPHSLRTRKRQLRKRRGETDRRCHAANLKRNLLLTVHSKIGLNSLLALLALLALRTARTQTRLTRLTMERMAAEPIRPTHQVRKT